MAKKIIWTQNALQDRLSILDYWFEIIGNKKYSNYLDLCFREAAEIISKYPQAGRYSQQANCRFIVKENYLLFYSESENDIFMLAIFDGRRNPESIKITK